MPYVLANSQTTRVPFPQLSPISGTHSSVSSSASDSGPTTPTECHGDEERSSRPRRKSSLKTGRPYRTPSPARTGSPFRRTKSVPERMQKLVHFPSQDNELQRVCTYSMSARPSSISNPTSDDEESSEEDDDPPTPLSAKYRIDTVHSRLPNLAVPMDSIIKLDAVDYSYDGALRGRVRVRNVAYNKQVSARFSLDEWESTSEVSAVYFSSSPCNGWETWTFTIRLEDLNLRNRTLSLCIHYIAEGVGEWWDNNNQTDYTIAFTLTRDSFAPPKTYWEPVQTTRRRSATVGDAPSMPSAGLPHVRARGSSWHDWAQNNTFHTEKPMAPTVSRSRPLFVV